MSMFYIFLEWNGDDMSQEQHGDILRGIAEVFIGGPIDYFLGDSKPSGSERKFNQSGQITGYEREYDDGTVVEYDANGKETKKYRKHDF